jgi:TrmH family RNA methyltransferase
VKTFEKDAALAVRPDTKLYFKEFGACLLPRITSVRREAFASQFQSSLQSLRRDDAAAFRRNCNALRYLLLNELGVETADWDFPADEGRGERSVLPMRVYLEDIRSPFNVGSIFRTAESFGIEMIYLSPGCPGPEHPRCRRSAMGTADTVPRQKTRLEDLIGTSAIPVTSIFALETGGCDLDRFIFPSDGLVLLGSEELGLSPRALEYADKGAGRVSIPLYGTKASLNVAVAFAIMVRQWYKYLTDSVQSHK